MLFHCEAFVLLSFVAWVVDSQSSSGGRPKTIECKFPHGNEPDPMEKCSHWFYQCDGDYTGHLSPCQENLYYDWVQMECDHYANVPECTGATRGPIRTTLAPRATTFDQSLFDCTRVDEGDYADERGTVFEDGRRVPYCANRYFQCSNGILSVKYCQKGYFYDQTVDQCGSLEEVFACNGGIRVTRPSTTRAPRLTTEDLHFSCVNQPIGNYPNPVDKCSHFYISCGDGGVATKVICPANTFYNRESGRCDDREAVFDCTGVRLTTTTTLTPPTRVTVPSYFFNCTGLENGKMYNNPEEKCSHTFFQCANGVGFKVICADSTYFDFYSQTCLQRDYVYECTGFRRPSTTAGPPTVSTAVPYYYNCTGLENGRMYPNPLEACSRIFYECSNGYGWRMLCAGENTYFDVYGQRCNYKRQVPVCNGLTGPVPWTSRTELPPRQRTSTQTSPTTGRRQ
jgi:hypothetical protein